MRLARLFVIFTTLCLGMHGCREDIQTTPEAVKAKQLLADYASESETVQANAKEEMRRIGRDVLPYLESVLVNPDDDSHNALRAIADIGEIQSLAFFTRSLQGKTALSRREAATHIAYFLHYSDVTISQARLFPNLSNAALEYLQTGGYYSIRLAKTLKLEEAIPILREMARDDDPKIRTRAVNAIAAITGKPVETTNSNESP